MQESAQSSPVLTPFGKYLLDEEIARGGMARVYLARLRGLGGFEKKLVVKQVRPELASDPRFVQMFVDEAKTLVQMSHPHVVPVYELGVVDGVYFLAMEHVEGATLAEILRAGGPLSPPLAAHVGVSVCDALQYAHARFDLVHRDVTPRNVIVDGLGHVRLLDFGIAAKADGMLEGEVFGSHGYMSPEQARGERLGPASDLFSLGAVLYEAVTGEPAFLRASNEETRAALDAEPPSLAARADVPAELAAVIDSLLARTPDERPASAAAVGKQLRGFLASVRPEGVAPELAQRVETARTRRAPSTRPPAPGSAPETGAQIRSIATSLTLERMLAAEPGDEPPRDTTEDPADDTAGTVQIPGRRSVEPPPPDADEPGTTRVARSEPRTPDTARDRGTAATPDTTRDPETAQKPRSPALAWAVVALIAGVGIAWALRSTTDVPSDREEPVPVAAAPADTEAVTEAETVAETEAETVAGTEAETAAETEAETAAQADTPADRGSGTADPGSRTTDDGSRTPDPTSHATVTITAMPWAEVQLDGRAVGNTPIRSLRLSPGAHVIVLANPPLGRDARVPLRVTANQDARVFVNLSASPPEVTVR